MRKLPLITAVAAGALWALPAFAGETSAPANTGPAVTLAQLDFCIGPDCRRDRDRRYYDRYYDRDHDRDWRYRDRGCRDVTIRERRDGEVVVRHERRCG